MHFQELDVLNLPRNAKEAGWLEVAPREGGGDWRLPYLYVTGAAAGPMLVVLGAVHGDEYEGVETIPRVFQQVVPGALRGTLLMVPICNVPAYEAATRDSPIDGKNLARVFPGDIDGTITQRIAYFLTEKLHKHTDFLIDLHSGGVTGNLPTLVGYIRSDDERGQRALAGALAFGTPVLWGHPLPVVPGRSLTAVTEWGIPSIYTEAPGGGEADPADVSCFTDGVLNVMKQLDMIDGEPKQQPMTHHLVGDGNLDDVIATPVAGYFRSEVNVLEDVSVGQCLGTVCDPFGDVVAEITTEQAGVVIMLRRIHKVHAGDNVAHVTGRLD